MSGGSERRFAADCESENWRGFQRDVLRRGKGRRIVIARSLGNQKPVEYRDGAARAIGVKIGNSIP